MGKSYSRIVQKFFICLSLLIYLLLGPSNLQPCEGKLDNPNNNKEKKREGPFLNLDISSQFVLDVLNNVLGFSIGTLLGQVELKSKIIGFLPDLEISVAVKSPQASILGFDTEDLSIDLKLKNPQNLQVLGLTAFVKTPKARIYGIEITDLTAQVSLEAGHLTISNLSAKIFDGELIGEFLIPLKPAMNPEDTSKDLASSLKLQVASSVLKLNLDGVMSLPDQKLDLQIDVSSPKLQVILKGISFEQKAEGRRQKADCPLPLAVCFLIENLQGELVYLRGKVAGLLKRPDFQGDLLLEEIKLSRSQIQQIKGQATYTSLGNQQAQLDFIEVVTPYQNLDHASFLIRRNGLDTKPDLVNFLFQAQKGDSLLKSEGSLTLDSKIFEATLRGKDLNLKDLGKLEDPAFAYEGRVDINIKGTGSLAHPEVQGYVKFKNLKFENRSVEDILTEIALRDRQLKLTVNAFKEEYTVGLALLLNSSLDYEFTLIMRQASIEKAIGLVRPAKSEIVKRVKGVLSGQILSEGSLRNLKEASARIYLDPVNLQIYNQSFINEKPLELIITKQKITFTRLKMVEKASGRGLFLQGDLNFKGDLNLGIDSRIDLRYLMPVIPRQVIQELSGEVDIVLDVRGTYKQPKFNGIIEINQGFVSLVDYPDPLTEITGKILLEKDQIELVEMKALLSDQSPVEINGNLSLEGRSLSSLNLEIRGQDIDLQVPEEAISIKTHANLALRGRPGTFVLSGNIDILHIQYLQELDLQFLIQSIQRRKALQDPIGSRTPGLRLNLIVRTRQTIKLAGPSIDLRLQMDLRVRGTTNKPEIQGRIETIGGTISFEDRKYSFSAGSIDFIDPIQINPDINLQANTDIDGYRIFLITQGNLDDFSLSLSSDPPLPEKDIAALLAFGGTPGQLLETLGAQQIAGLIIPPVQNQFGGRLEKLTRLDRVEVQALSTQNGSESSSLAPRLVLGKELFRDLYVTFSTNVGTSQKKQVVQLRYVISDRFSLVVEQDSEDQTNVTARFRFEFK